MDTTTGKLYTLDSNEKYTSFYLCIRFLAVAFFPVSYCVNNLDSPGITIIWKEILEESVTKCTIYMHVI